MKSLFITNPSDLHSVIPGGVQLCSQEFLETIQTIYPQVVIFNVSVSKNLFYRLKRKVGLDSYDLYDFKKYEDELVETLQKNNIDIVFINKAELVKVSKILKEIDRSLKIILLSHGNETGDYLHELTHPQKKHNLFVSAFKKIRLGLNLFTESYYRHRYLDLVCTMSLEEESIEKWLGANNTFFFPRIIKLNPIQHKPEPRKIGFVGTLNHTPNFLALKDICKELSLSKFSAKLIIVGGGEEQGVELASAYPFVFYLGRLDNEDLINEVSTWAYFLNPIFWYSRGASMKLAQALSWNVPVISTIAGARGYKFKKQFLKLTPNNANEFVNELIIRLQREKSNNEKGLSLLEDVFYTKEEIGAMLLQSINQL